MNRIVAAAICICPLVGCGGDGAPTTAPPPAPTPAPPPTPPPPPEPPSVPTGLRASASGEEFIEWTWNMVDGVSGYDVQFSANEAFTSEDEIITRTGEELSYRREGLAAGTSANLRVRSASGSGDDRITSDWSTHVTGMTAAPEPQIPPLPVPTELRVSDRGEDFIEWTWDPVDGVSGYDVQFSLDETFDSADEIIGRTADQTSYRRQPLPAGSAAFLRVRAHAGAGEERLESNWSTHVTGMTAAPAPPTLPARVWALSAPSSSTGYAAGERIVLVATFEETTTVRGSPRLAIQIGEDVRLADFSPWVEDDFPPERPSVNQRFAYEVTRDDADADGISVATDAFDFSEGALLNAAGVEIEIEIYAVAPGRNAPDPVGPGEALDTHRVMGTPPPQTYRARGWVHSTPAIPPAYTLGETIVVGVTFDGLTTVEGNPRLAIEIGEHVRLADYMPWVKRGIPPEEPYAHQQFVYEVTREDADADGISVAADAFDFSEGSIFTEAGVEIEAAEIYAVRGAVSVDPGEALDAHRVMGTPQPRACGNERQFAARFSDFVQEWDGTPIRVDMFQNFPDVGTEADVVELLDAVGLLADKIEDQLGYRILEMGDVIPLPEGLSPGWNTDSHQFSRTCPLPRDRGTIQGFYMDTLHHASPEADAQANRCGSFSYLQPFLTYWPCRGCEDERTPPPYGHFVDGVTHHEIFHVLGYIHTEDYDPDTTTEGVPMSWTLRGAQAPDAEAVLWSDIDLLRCVFPEDG